MNSKTIEINSIANPKKLADLPETIAKNKRQKDLDQSRSMRRHFEKMREEKELSEQLTNSLDDYDDY